MLFLTMAPVKPDAILLLRIATSTMRFVSFPSSHHHPLTPPVGRHRLDAHILRARPAHDSRSRLLLLRSRTPQIRSLPHMAFMHVRGRRIISMVLLGLLPHVLAYCQLLYWGSHKYWIPQRVGGAKCWKCEDPGFIVCDLPGNVRCDYVRLLFM